MIILTDKDKEEILYLDEKKKPLKQLISRQRITMLLCILILILLLVSGGLIVYTQFIHIQTGLIVTVDAPIDPDDIPGFDEDRIPIPEDIKVEELNEKLDAGKMCINMVSRVYLSNAYSAARINFINDKANLYPQYITITLNSNNTVVYRSGLINPGDCIPYARLDTALPKGSYDCTVTFTQVNLDTKSICGKAAAKVNITIDK